jgi:hypothetical protein
VCLLNDHIKLTIIAIKPSRLLSRALLFGVAVSLMLPLFGCATDVEKRQTSMIENEAGAQMNRAIWRKMSDAEKHAYARQSLLDIGENPDAFVSKGKTREMLLLEGLEAVYAK